MIKIVATFTMIIIVMVTDHDLNQFK